MGDEDEWSGSPPVRFESVMFGDPRFVLLAQLIGVDRYSAWGRMAELWSVCTRRRAYVLSEAMVRASLGATGAESIVEAELGDRVEGGIRIRGTRGRIEWWIDSRVGQTQRSRAGGRARALSAVRDARGRMVSTDQPRWSPAGDPLEEGDLDCSIGDDDDAASTSARPAGLQRDSSDSPADDLPGPATSASANSLLAESPPPSSSPKARRKSTARRVADPTASPSPRARAKVELASFLDWFNAKNGRSFEVRDQLVAWTQTLLSRGYSQDDLRKVAEDKRIEWGEDAEMQKHLVPGTLLRPSNFDRYVDAAREAYAKEHPPEPDPIFDVPDGPAFDLGAILGGGGAR